MDTAVSVPLVLATLGMLATSRPPLARTVFDIQIHLQIDQSIATRVHVLELQDEAEQIWQPYGVRITWSDSVAQREPFPLTAVLGWRFDRAGAPSGPMVLGRAVIGPSDPPTRPIRISFQATEATLALRRNAWTSVAGRLHDREMARALGRVLAHEVGHVLLALRVHEQTGLMREFFTPEDLARADRSAFALTPHSERRLRTRVETLKKT